MKSLIAVLLLSAGLVGCGTIPSSSGVMLVGPDTFRVISRADYGEIIPSQQMAFKEANAFCASNSKLMVANSTRIHEFNRGFELNFHCLSKGDPDLIRPQLLPAPNTVIQIR